MTVYVLRVRGSGAAGAAPGDAITVLEAFVARFDCSRVPLTRLVVAHALYSLAALYTDKRRALATLERAALHNDVVATPLHRVAIDALLCAHQVLRAHVVAEHLRRLCPSMSDATNER